ncbi:hypothetical protein, partial [Vibrio parahaemolyticus]|uniref:hypothetical protein n=1 Tax=Vibrio parahaemolyticus TaxID=670 RepID=UPI0032AF4DA4
MRRFGVRDGKEVRNKRQFLLRLYGVRFLMSHTLLGVTEFNGSFSGKQKGMRDASLCYFCLIKSEIKL